MILMRETTALCSAFGGDGRSMSAPSMRYRRREVRSIASKWMSDAFVFSASIMMVFTMRMTGASPAASTVASMESAGADSDEISTSASWPFMMFSIASAGLAASSFAFSRPIASAISPSGATVAHTEPPHTRTTSSREGKSNGSANATVVRPATRQSGSAFADAQKSAVWPASSDESGAKPGGTVIGGIEKWSAAASARSAGSVIDRISSIDRRAAGFIR